ncbi:hypothetical protein FRA_26c01600 [Francisella sp. W12-1067]|nr:hypothetical protein FRA_26c01600 [Francisella sp. W12-1067]
MYKRYLRTVLLLLPALGFSSDFKDISTEISVKLKTITHTDDIQQNMRNYISSLSSYSPVNESKKKFKDKLVKYYEIAKPLKTIIKDKENIYDCFAPEQQPALIGLSNDKVKGVLDYFKAHTVKDSDSFDNLPPLSESLLRQCEGLYIKKRPTVKSIEQDFNLYTKQNAGYGNTNAYYGYLQGYWRENIWFDFDYVYATFFDLLEFNPKLVNTDKSGHSLNQLWLTTQWPEITKSFETGIIKFFSNECPWHFFTFSTTDDYNDEDGSDYYNEYGGFIINKDVTPNVSIDLCYATKTNIGGYLLMFHNETIKTVNKEFDGVGLYLYELDKNKTPPPKEVIENPSDYPEKIKLLGIYLGRNMKGYSAFNAGAEIAILKGKASFAGKMGRAGVGDYNETLDFNNGIQCNSCDQGQSQIIRENNTNMAKFSGTKSA